MKYTKQIIAKLLEDKTTDNDFINQLRGLALLAKDETESNSGGNAGYKESVSQGGAVAEVKIKLKEANQFILEIAELLDMNIDGIGYDGIQFGLDDFKEAITKIKATSSL